MEYDQSTIRSLYKRLIAFYPRVFKEQLGESMEQTFNDLCNGKQQTKKALLGFVLWTFIETALGIFREHLLLIIEGDIMQSILTNLRSPALISLVLMLPFMILELVNRRNFNEGFPFALFSILWLLPMLFMLTVMPVVRNVRAGSSIIANPIILLLRVVFLSFTVWMWASLMIDQLPCFLGVPNCD